MHVMWTCRSFGDAGAAS